MWNNLIIILVSDCNKHKAHNMAIYKAMIWLYVEPRQDVLNVLTKQKSPEVIFNDFHLQTVLDSDTILFRNFHKILFFRTYACFSGENKLTKT